MNISMERKLENFLAELNSQSAEDIAVDFFSTVGSDIKHRFCVSLASVVLVESATYQYDSYSEVSHYLSDDTTSFKGFSYDPAELKAA